MLVLSRRIDERIVIGPTVTVTVLEIRGDRVKLGISAPAEVPVHRQEVQRRIECKIGKDPACKLHEVDAYVSPSADDRHAGD